MTEETRKIMLRKLADYLVARMDEPSFDGIHFRAFCDLWQEAWIAGVAEYTRTHPQPIWKPTVRNVEDISKDDDGPRLKGELRDGHGL